MRDLKCLSWWYCSRTCLHMYVSYPAPIFKLPAEYLRRGRGMRAGRHAQVELHRKDGVRRKNVMRKVAS